MMDTENSSKKLLRQYGILAGFIAGMFGILIAVIVLSRSSWQNGLKTAVTQVLEEEEPGQWIVGNYVRINAPVSLSAACFETRRKDNGARGYVLMMRIETAYGPFPAVFVSGEKADARFVGISGLHGRVRTLIGNGSGDAKIIYWVKRIPDILKNAEGPVQNDLGVGK
jgi:hypothetical protein